MLLVVLCSLFANKNNNIYIEESILNNLFQVPGLGHVQKLVNNNDPDAVVAAKAAARSLNEKNAMHRRIAFEKIVKGERVTINGYYYYYITFVALSASEYPLFYSCEISVKKATSKTYVINCEKIKKEEFWRILDVQ